MLYFILISKRDGESEWWKKEFRQDGKSVSGIFKMEYKFNFVAGGVSLFNGTYNMLWLPVQSLSKLNPKYALSSMLMCGFCWKKVRRPPQMSFSGQIYLCMFGVMPHTTLRDIYAYIMVKHFHVDTRMGEQQRPNLCSNIKTRRLIVAWKPLAIVFTFNPIKDQNNLVFEFSSSKTTCAHLISWILLSFSHNSTSEIYICINGRAICLRNRDIKNRWNHSLQCMCVCALRMHLSAAATDWIHFIAT